MARPERPLDLTNPVHAFAAELRKLRASAGGPKYLAMARRADGVSRTALSEAAGGDHLPTWRTVEKFVLACGGHPMEWRRRWEDLRDQLQERRAPDPGRSAMEGEDALPAGDRRGQGPERTGPNPEPSVMGGQEAMSTVEVPRRPSRWRLAVATTSAICLVVVAGVLVGLLRDEPDRTLDAAADPRLVAVPKGPAVVVQNMIAVGKDSLIEDSTPAYLSTRTVPRCRLNGCMVSDTILATGISVVATCQAQGTWMTNYNLDSTEVQSNPNRAASSRWYRLVLSDGRAGFLSEVYLSPASRGGLGLPTCAPDVPVSSP
jgi:hypothetical protein